jgi:hypothetical protein
MKLLRISLLLAAAMIVPACGGKKITNVYNSTTTGPGGVAPSPFPVIGTSPAGTTGFNEAGGVGGLGSDGQPRSVFLSADGSGNLQIRFSRRNADGTWSAILPISANNADVKDQLTVIVTQSNNFTHIFWLEGATNAVYQLHYAQVDNGATPALTVSDTIISTGPTIGVDIGGAYGRVFTFTTAVDPLLSNVYVEWVQRILDGGTDTDVPLVGAVISGAGPFLERFALVSPTGASFNFSSKLPLLRVAANGRVHAAYVSTFAGGARVLHRLRTAPGTWTSGPNGNSVSAILLGSPDILLMDLALASDGDAYVGWWNALGDIRASRRPAGDGAIFGADNFATSQSGFSKLTAVLEPGTKRLHLVLGISKISGAGRVYTSRNPAADLSGAWENETILSVASANPGATPVDYFAWSDSSNHVSVAIQSPPVLNDLPHLLVTSRASGTGNGLYSPVKDITAPAAMPCFDLTVATNLSGQALIVWRQGQANIVPLGEVFGALYTPGGAFGTTFNLSQSPALGSHGPIFALLMDSGTGYVSWLETVTSGPPTDDIYFALKP